MTIYFEKTYQRAYGTFPLKGEEARQAILAAIKVGYRAFDTAQMYGNETEVGAALAESGVPRSDLCITTKVRNDNYGEDAFLASVEGSLKALGLDHVDVLLMHWPPADGDIAPPLKLLEQAHKRGLARNIGISNFTAAMMRRAITLIEAPIVTNQVEFHPLLNQDILLDAAVETGIPLSSYCSMARGKVFEHPEFAEIAQAYDKTGGQIVLRWILQKGVSINTMSTKPNNIRANFEVMDFALSSVDMALIDALTHTNYRIVTREKMPIAPDFD